MIQSLKELIARIREDLSEEAKFVHNVTDSSSSQYRNIHMFSVLAQHLDLFGAEASGFYFEAGHGKGRAMVMAALPREWPMNMYRPPLITSPTGTLPGR